MITKNFYVKNFFLKALFSKYKYILYYKILFKRQGLLNKINPEKRKLQFAH